jgi:DNA-binding protein H-NS
MSFADLLKMKDGKEKEEIINGLTDAGFSAYEEYIDVNKQVANQRIEEKKRVADVTNQRIEEMKRVHQAVINEVIALDISNI